MNLMHIQQLEDVRELVLMSCPSLPLGNHRSMEQTFGQNSYVRRFRIGYRVAKPGGSVHHGVSKPQGDRHQ